MSVELGSDGLSDWSVVTSEGHLEVGEDSSSSDDFLKVSPDFEHGQEQTEDKTEQDVETESAASSIHNFPTMLVESTSSSIEEEMSSTTSSCSTSDAACSTTDLGFQEEDGKMGVLHTQCHSPVLERDGPGRFHPDSPESVRLQDLLAVQSDPYPVMQTIAVIQLANTGDLSSDSDSDFVHLDQSSSSEDSLSADEPCPVEAERVSPSVCNEETMEQSVSSVSACFRFMPHDAGQDSDSIPDSDIKAVVEDGDKQSVITVDQNNHTESALNQDVAETAADVGVGVASPDVGVASPDVGVASPDVGVASPDVGVASPDVGVASPDVGVASPDVGVASPDVGVASPDVGVASPDVGVTSPDVGVASPDVGVASPDVGVASPDVGVASLDDHSSGNDSDDAPLMEEADHPDVRPPRRGFSFSLNIVGLLIISIAVAFAVGHSIGSLRIHNSWIAGQQENEFKLQRKLSDMHNVYGQLQQYYEQERDTVVLKKREITQLESHNKELREKEDRDNEEKRFLQKESSMVRLLLQDAESNSEVIRNKNDELKSEVHNVWSKNVLLKKENQELKAQLKDADRNYARIQESVNDQQNWEDEHHRLLELLDKRNLLEKENSVLRADIERFRHELYFGHDKGQEGIQDNFVNEPDRGKKDVLVGLKNAVNQLEIENEDLGDEIVRHRYQSHTARRDTKSEPADSSYQHVIIKQLTVDLEKEQAKSKKWRKLYEAQKKNSTTVDGHSCLSLLCNHLNNSVSQYVNVTAVLSAIHNISHSVADNVKDMKDVLFNEVKQNYESVKKTMFAESKSDDHKKQGEKSNTGSSREDWINTVSEVLNKTRNSVANVTRQIQDTWVQVKNISKSFWKKYEPSLVEVANKLSRKVADVGWKFHEKIKKKASRWWRKKSNKYEKWQKKTHRKYGHSSETASEYMNDENLRRNKNKKFKRNWDTNTGRVNPKDEKDRVKAYEKLVKRMSRITIKRHQRMNSEDISNLCAMFSTFARLWDVNQWLSDTERTWFVCQRDWWLDRRDGIKRNLRGRGHCLQNWQLEWEPSGFNDEFQKKNKREKHPRRCRQKHKMSEGNCKEKNPYPETSEHHFKRHHEADYERRPFDDKHDFREKHHHKHDSKRQHHHHEGNPHHHHYHHGSESLKDDDDFLSFYDDMETMEDSNINPHHHKGHSFHHYHQDSESFEDDYLETMEDSKKPNHHHKGSYHYHHESEEEEDFSSLFDDVETADYLDDSIFWPLLDDDCKKPNKTIWSEEQEDWYLKLGRHRLAQHEDEHKSDWLFDRAADRKTQRGSTSHSSQRTFAKPVDQEFGTAHIDPKSEWVFTRADDREFHRSTPDNWYFNRYQGRTKNNDNFDSYEN